MVEVEKTEAPSVVAKNHSWTCDVETWKPSQQEFDKVLSLVQPEEQTRIKKFRFEIDRKRALAGRLLIRKLISDNFGIPWKDIKLARTKEGKPFLANDISKSATPLYNFNLSHHGSWVVISGHTNLLIGVDVMKYDKPRGDRSVADFFNTMKSSFTDREWVTIRSRPKNDIALTTIPGRHEQLVQFYRHWSLKESYIKAIGIGLGFGLQRATFLYTPSEEDLYSPRAKVLIDGKLQEQWNFAVECLDDDHCAAVAFGPFSEALPEYLKSFDSNAVKGASLSQHASKEETEKAILAELKKIKFRKVTVEELIGSDIIGTVEEEEEDDIDDLDDLLANLY